MFLSIKAFILWGQNPYQIFITYITSFINIYKKYNPNVLYIDPLIFEYTANIT